MGLTFEKLMVIGVIAVFLLGPERLPDYAAKLARFIKQLRTLADGAKDRMRDEMGPEFDEVDWKRLDPRQYDPRRIIRDALLEDDAAGFTSNGSAGRNGLGAAGTAVGAGAVAASGAVAVAAPFSIVEDLDAPLNYDSEAT